MANGRQDVADRHVRTLFGVGVVGDLTDGQLLERFRAQTGEAAELAFAALVERHGPMVLRTCRAVLRDSADANDAFQATFLVLMRRARSLWVRDSLGAWLHQVAHRTACCARSAALRRKKHESHATRWAARPTYDFSPDDLGEVLHEEIDRLPEPNRAAVVLCLVEGLTHEDAARALRWPVGTVQSRLARGRERLRDRLTRRGVAPALGLVLVADAAGASVPAALVGITARAAVRLGKGRWPAEAVSAAVTHLTAEAQRMIFLSKLRRSGAAALGVGLVATGVGLFAQRGSAQPDSPRSEQVQVLQIPAPYGGARMKILVSGPGDVSESFVPEVGPDGRLHVTVEHQEGKSSKLTKIICSSIQIVTLARPEPHLVAQPQPGPLAAPQPDAPAANRPQPKVPPSANGAIELPPLSGPPVADRGSNQRPPEAPPAADRDVERRLGDVKRKLDLILKAMEGSRRSDGR